MKKRGQKHVKPVKVDLGFNVLAKYHNHVFYFGKIVGVIKRKGKSWYQVQYEDGMTRRLEDSDIFVLKESTSILKGQRCMVDCEADVFGLTEATVVDSCLTQYTIELSSGETTVCERKNLGFSAVQADAILTQQRRTDERKRILYDTINTATAPLLNRVLNILRERGKLQYTGADDDDEFDIDVENMDDKTMEILEGVINAAEMCHDEVEDSDMKELDNNIENGEMEGMAYSEKYPNDSEKDPDDTERDPDDIERYPDGTERDPDDTERVPDDTERDPDDTERDPDGTERDPDGTERDPDDTERDPDDTERDPDDTERDPDGTEKDPDGTERDPDDTERDPDDTERDPDDSDIDLDDSDKDSDFDINKCDRESDNSDRESDNSDRESDNSSVSDTAEKVV